jgi:Ni/Co efflux regulator RcnB
MRTSLISMAVLALVGAATPTFAHPSANGWSSGAAPLAQAPTVNLYHQAGWDDDKKRGRGHRDDDRRHGGRHDDNGRYDDRRADARDWQRGRGYSYNRPDPRYNGYYADNYYRSGAYQPRRLGVNDRVYRGQDNRYYCRRSDGTTGLIIGALGGGVLGNVIAPGGSKTLGSILGGGLGAVLGSSIDKGNVTCR